MTGTIKKLLYLALALTLILTTCGCSLLPTEEDVIAPPLVEPEVIEYKTTVVGREDIFDYMTVSASFVSTETFKVSFEERAGYISLLGTANGAKVEEGQILAQLDVDALQKQIVMQEYAVERCRLYLDAAIDGKLDYQMSDDQKRSVRLAEIDLEIAQISLNQSYEELDKSTIYAPVAGDVVFMTAKRVGEYIGVKDPVCTIADPTTLFLKYTGEDLDKFVLNAEVEVTIQNEKYVGVVVATPQTAPEESTTERQYVLIDVTDKPEDTEIGDLATCRVIIDQRLNVLCISRSLVSSYGSGSYYVQVIGEDGSKMEQPIEIGLMTSTQVEVVAGLEEGDEIIVR